MTEERTMKVNCVIGIDPGAAGGIAVYVPNRLPKVYKMPKDMTALQELLEYYRDNYAPVVFLEKLSVRADDVTVTDDKAALGKLYRIQKMMANYEHLKAIIEVSGLPYVLVHPLTWQTKLGLRTRGEHLEKAERKRIYKERAAKAYPGVNVTLWNADALMIMHFGRWALVNSPKWVKSNLPEREYQKLF